MLILTLSHIRVLFALHEHTSDASHTQRALRDQFFSGQSSRRRLPTSPLERSRQPKQSQLDQSARGGESAEDVVRYEARVEQKGYEEDEGGIAISEVNNDVKANQEKQRQGLYPEAKAGPHPFGSDTKLQRNREGQSAAPVASEKFLAENSKVTTLKIKHPAVWEEVVYPTPNDPDGLKQILDLRWSKVQCDFNETLAPPQIHLDRPFIDAAREGEQRPQAGILIDAARHFFPLPWLYGLVDFLTVLGFDLIHFRLTDDQSFVVQLDCHPQLAQSAHPYRTGEVYTAQELRELVLYAKDRGVSIVPEVNVPGHAGAWSGIPGMVYPCADFICGTSYSIPMRINHPMVLQVIEDVLKEVLDIFASPPYLHLGGDEVFMSEPCFRELQVWPNFQKFEDALKEMLLRLNVNSKTVARWETTGNSDAGSLPLNRKHLKRAGEITHWWNHVPVEKEDVDRPFFISTDLYFDTSEDRDAWDVASIAAERFGLNPTAVIAATFELGPCTFQVRNVWGKLIAVAMAAKRDMPQSRNEFIADYRDICARMGLANAICDLEGRPPLPTYFWKPSHSILKKAWSASICERMTYPAKSFGMRRKDAVSPHESSFLEIARGRAPELRKQIAEAKAKRSVSYRKDPIYEFAYNHTGVMVDLAHQYFPIQDLRRIIDFVSQLGFNLLHVRLIENESFPIKMLEYRHLSLRQKHYKGSYTEDDFRQLVDYASNLGVRLMPEINFMSNAGGWLQSGLLVSCPNYICDTGGPIPLDVNRGRTLATVSMVCGSILKIFGTAPFLHLGNVDPDRVEPCYREAYPIGEVDLRNTFQDAQKIILRVFQNMGVAKTRIVTWESPNDQLLGGIVHFSKTRPVGATVTRPFLVSTGTSVESMEDDNAWQIYQQTRFSHNSGAMGVVVGTKGMDIEEWESRNVMGRLIAIGAALSNQEEMDEALFISHYAEICAKLGMPRDRCDSFGKPVSSATDWAKEQDSKLTKRQQSTCTRFTSSGIARLPKESLFDTEPQL